ncbi:MAG: NADH-quinone oxidoreductase subunit J family protein [Acidimicrobiales bacterium]
MVAQNIAFGIIAAVVTVGAIMTVTTRNVVHAALYLVAVLAGVGASFLLLGAEFVGITQVLVYIGAIVVLFLFGIMLTKAPIGKSADLTGRNWFSGVVVAVALAGVLGYVLVDAFDDQKIPKETRQLTADVSDTIFGPYLVPFEVSSMLILASLIGAIVLARKD